LVSGVARASGWERSREIEKVEALAWFARLCHRSGIEEVAAQVVRRRVSLVVTRDLLPGLRRVAQRSEEVFAA
jgi:hypothetical protein